MQLIGIAILRAQRFCGAFRRTFVMASPDPKFHLRVSFCTQVPTSSLDSGSENEHIVAEGDAGVNSLSSRIEKLPRGEAIGSAFQSWMGDGFSIHRGHIFHTINRLRRLNSTKRALEVMEWVIRERPYRPKELDYSYLLEFTSRLHGVSQAESLFCRIPSEFQNELLYNNLVLVCLDRGLIRLSLAYMKKMRELGHQISHLVFNRLIILHSSPGRRKSIPKILIQMKADKVTQHVSTFNILLKIEANEHNIEGLVKVCNDMKRAKVQPNEVTYCILATAHAVARLYTKELERTWGITRELPHVKSKSYMLAIEAFGRIGDLNRAEGLWLEMKLEKGLKSIEQFNSMIAVYCKHGLVTKATGLYKEMEACGLKANSITFRHLALGCLKAGGLVKEAMKTLDLGMDMTTSIKVKRSIPWLETTLSIIEILADNGELKMVETLFEELKKAKYTRYTFVYNALIKSYVKAKVYDPNLLKRMVLGGARPDSETYSLLKLIEQFQT
nr:pentatricopeptide repeat-containing protein At1g07590, mitochondrial isoform X1 [Ipomoea batatas]